MTTTYTDNLMITQSLGPSRRSSRRALAVRAMAGATSWLDGRLRWRDGRVAWEVGARLVVPGAADLSLAQRCHYNIRRYPIAARLALGDAEAWLERRQARLELAKRLSVLHAPDLPGLEQQARAGDPAAIARLAALLSVEALCLDRLPASPAAVLAGCGWLANTALLALLDDRAAPSAAQALAALTLGAIDRSAGDIQRGSTTAVLPRSLRVDGWLGRAYQWGRRQGVPRDPALILVLLAGRDGDALALRYAQTLRGAAPFQLAPDLLRELLARGLPAERVVALADAAVAAGPLARRILAGQPAQLTHPRGRRRPVVECSLDQRRQFVTSLAARLAQYVCAAPTPEIVPLFTRCVAVMLDFGPLTSDLAEMIDRVLRRGLKDLPSPLQHAYLDLLVEQHGRFWDRSQLPPDAQRITGWLESCWTSQIMPLLGLLAATGDAAIVREALEQGMVALLARQGIHDAELCRWLLALLRAFDSSTGDETAGAPRSHHISWLANLICDLSRRLTSGRATRAALQPIVDGLMAAPPTLRATLLAELLDELESLDGAPRDALLRLVRYLPAVVDFAARSQYPRRCWSPLAALLALDHARPDDAPAWYSCLLAQLLEHENRPRGVSIGSIDQAALFAVALAEDDLARFQAVFRAALHSFDLPWEGLQSGVAMLKRLPALRAALAQNFVQQPQRCSALLVRVGLAMRLGPDALALLAELESPTSAAFLQVDPQDAGRGWGELLDHAPDMAATAAAYLHAQWLLGGSIELPAGVRRALDQPRKLARELAFLEQALLRQPGRADLAARCASLRERLADQGRLLGAARAEARERMAQATAQGLLAAAEQQALECYRHRLMSVVGALPSDLQFDDDLLNATLLTLDVRHNRRLLLRLLRAHLSGERGWREQHPANSAFLQTLAERGCDNAAWLSAMPRVYRCAGVAGGRVRLHLERDPLRILQMGNLMDTCLAFGGINSFSTVANACELNKRVIYASDANGRIVGRKLIAVSEEWKLVGFHTYSSLGDTAGNAALRAVFRRYVADFAARCGLELAESGTVARLLSEAWYDDGVVAWAEESGKAIPPGTAGRPPESPGPCAGS